jgi:hypothetical protein
MSMRELRTRTSSSGYASSRSKPMSSSVSGEPGTAWEECELAMGARRGRKERAETTRATQMAVLRLREVFFYIPGCAKERRAREDGVKLVLP